MHSCSSSRTGGYGFAGTPNAKLTNFRLLPEELTVEIDEPVVWSVGKNETSNSGVYLPGERYFVLEIQETGFETDKLYTGDTFTHRFTQTGVFTVRLQAQPYVKQRVKVVMPWKSTGESRYLNSYAAEYSRNGTEDTSDNATSPRDESSFKADQTSNAPSSAKSRRVSSPNM